MAKSTVTQRELNRALLARLLLLERIAGIQEVEIGRVRTNRFERLDPALERELGDEAERLAAFHE